MKRLFVIIPAVLITLFVLNSFLAPGGKVAKRESVMAVNVFWPSRLAGIWEAGRFPRDSVYDGNRSRNMNTVYKSTDGGKSWQDISKALPVIAKAADVQRDGYFANSSGFYLRAGNGIYQDKSSSTTLVWKKEVVSDNKYGSIASANGGIYAYNYNGGISRKIDGGRLWSPKYTNFKGKVRTVFETTHGSVFIGSDNGLFKSTNGGKSWKHVHKGGWVTKLAESNGVLAATSIKGIIRSNDKGENWDLVISEGGVGIDVQPIKGGFAAITYNTKSQTRRVRASYDGGKSWQPIDAGLKSVPSISSIVQLGDNLFCGHPNGIFRSSDRGKTWKVLLPSKDKKVFNVMVSGSAIYAVPRNEGC